MASLWQANTSFPHFPALQGDLNREVAVIGGGIAGLLTAALLRRAGLEAVVLEREQIASGVTAGTTAKITAQHGLIYDKLIRRFGKERARQYAHANQQAVEAYWALTAELGISCGLEKTDAYVYSTADGRKTEREAAAARTLGLPAALVTKTALPFSVTNAVRFSKQAQFHPLAFLAALCKELEIYEHTMATAIGNGEVLTTGGVVRAKAVVLATHFPIINVPGFFFLRMHQERSYVLALENAAPVDGMYIGEEKNSLSFRNAEGYLLLGGAGMRTGKNGEGGNFERLWQSAKVFYPASKVKFQWAAQDCMPHDQLPMIGPVSGSLPGLYVATGFQKWGMTTAMAAAEILTDLISGRENQDAPVFSPQRFHPIVSAPRLLLDGAQTAYSIAKEKLELPRGALLSIPNGTAAVIRVEGEKVGVYKTPEGGAYFVTVRCPHLGCRLEWNPEERSWDCPCHGSRFDYTGRLLNEPAQTEIHVPRQPVDATPPSDTEQSG